MLIAALILLSSSAISSTIAEKNRPLGIYIFTAQNFGDYLEQLTASAASFGGEVKTLAYAHELCNNDLSDAVVMAIEPYPCIFAAPIEEIIKQFETFNADIVIAATTSQVDSEFLPSTSFFGKAKAICEILEIINVHGVEARDLASKIWLTQNLIPEIKVSLDIGSKIYQSLDDQVTLKPEAGSFVLLNELTQTKPKVLLSSYEKADKFNHLADLIAYSHPQSSGISKLKERLSNIAQTTINSIFGEDLPIITLALIVDQPTPFLPLFFELISKLEYPANRIALVLYNTVEYHGKQVSEAAAIFETAGYFKYLLRNLDSEKTEIFDVVHKVCQEVNCKFAFFLDSRARPANPEVLKQLISIDKDLVAPMLIRANGTWNFMFSVDSSVSVPSAAPLWTKRGFRGVWNVPQVSMAIMMKQSLLKELVEQGQSLASACEYMRRANRFMYATNLVDFGHLVTGEGYKINRVHPDLYEIAKNPIEWERVYVDPGRFTVPSRDITGKFVPRSTYERCRNVYQFPLVTELFCDHLVDEAEYTGGWSQKQNDPYPTTDVILTSMGFESEWQELCKRYIAGLVEYSFPGYKTVCASKADFVIRYRPDEQSSLKPHFDTSTYSYNIALRRGGIDYEGGGLRITSKNCSVMNQPKGSIVIHPGRLTHWHEGLPVTKGTRYIAITFADPYP